MLFSVQTVGVCRVGTGRKIQEMLSPEAIYEPVSESNAESVAPFGALDLLIVVLARWRLLALTIAGFTILGATLAYVVKPSFTSTAIILPPQQQQSSASALLGQLSALSSIGGASALGLKSSADMYVGILKSRTIADGIVKQFDLERVYKTKKMTDTRKALASHTEVEVGKDGLIHISVTDHDPNRASEIANAYVDGLYRMNSGLAVTEAAQRRVFFDQQLDEEKKALTNAEDDLRTTEQRTGVIQLGGQTQELLYNMASLRAQLSSEEVQLQALRTYATDQNPDVMVAEQKIATLRGQISKLESDQQMQSSPGDITLSAGRTPEDSLEYARKLREVKYHDTLYDLLSKQREAARIDEAKSAPVLQSIDRAVPSDKKSGPPRLLLTIGAGFVGFVAGVAWILLSYGIGRLRWYPESAAKLRRLERVFRAQSI
jgi:uncharacterized protein involved in exopolysaccharide biosynthesis